MIITFEHSFFTSHIVNPEQIQAAYEMCKAKHDGQHFVDLKDEIQNGMMLEAYDRGGIEAFAVELVRLMTRTTLDAFLDDAFGHVELVDHTKVKTVHKESIDEEFV